MRMVLLTALGVGGATVFGALLGFAFKKISHKFSDIVLAFAAGVMLAAAVIGLILPSLEYGGKFGLLVTVAGIFCGALCLNLLDRLVPHLHRLSGVDQEAHPGQSAQLSKVLLFVMAIAIHNLPEGMVIIAPMLAAGMKPGRTFLIAMLTGIVEVLGTLLGYFAVTISTAILPFALAFAGGTMLYVISDEMIPETHAHGSERGATYSLLAGFALMLAMSYYL